MYQEIYRSTFVDMHDRKPKAHILRWVISYLVDTSHCPEIIHIDSVNVSTVPRFVKSNRTTTTLFLSSHALNAWEKGTRQLLLHFHLQFNRNQEKRSQGGEKRERKEGKERGRTKGEERRREKRQSLHSQIQTIILLHITLTFTSPFHSSRV